MTTLMGGVNAALPKISYMKSIDVYLSVCFFMVFGALIGMSTVYYIQALLRIFVRRGGGGGV